jgi:hypothetical protein
VRSGRATRQDVIRGPTRLEWLLHAKAREAINEAVVHAKALCEDLDLAVDCFSTKTGGWVGEVVDAVPR